MGKIANCQSLALSERGQLSQAIPQFQVERMLNEWTPVVRFESRHNKRRAYEDQFLCFRGRYDRQRTLAIRAAAITLASDSAITIARFCPSKLSSTRICWTCFWVVTLAKAWKLMEGLTGQDRRVRQGVLVGVLGLPECPKSLSEHPLRIPGQMAKSTLGAFSGTLWAKWPNVQTHSRSTLGSNFSKNLQKLCKNRCSGPISPCCFLASTAPWKTSRDAQSLYVLDMVPKQVAATAPLARRKASALTAQRNLIAEHSDTVAILDGCKPVEQ